MNKTTILVVEDDIAVRNLITTTLDTHDYRYIRAENGQNALKAISSKKPDIVLLDLGLPDIDGIDVIKQLVGGADNRDKRTLRGHRQNRRS